MIDQQAFFLEFTDTRMSGSFEGAPLPVLAPYVLEDAPEYLRVALDTVADDTLRIRGDISGETVTIAFDARLDRTYTSTDAGREPYTARRRPEHCEPVTLWFWDFLDDNVSFADEFTATYLVQLALYLGISYESHGHDTVSITGELSGETVTVWYDGEETVFYESSFATREAYDTPRSNVIHPPWSAEFCGENLKP